MDPAFLVELVKKMEGDKSASHVWDEWNEMINDKCRVGAFKVNKRKKYNILFDLSSSFFADDRWLVMLICMEMEMAACLM